MPTPALAANLLSFVMPLTAAGLVPALLLAHIGWAQALTAVHPERAVAGALLAAAGLTMLAWTVTLFIRIGRGTLAPWDPTRKLVVRGPYAHVRNPMITGVLAILIGEALTVRIHHTVVDKRADAHLANVQRRRERDDQLG